MSLPTDTVSAAITFCYRRPMDEYRYPVNTRSQIQATLLNRAKRRALEAVAKKEARRMAAAIGRKARRVALVKAANAAE